MPMVATKAPYTLFIVEDEDAQNPRENCDCFGKMVCFHRRYNLGDKHDYEEPQDFLKDFLFRKYSSYGYQLFNGNEEIDNCWGFLGDIRDVQDAVKEYLPTDCEDIVENLQFRYDIPDIEDYLEEVQENELDEEL